MNIDNNYLNLVDSYNTNGFCIVENLIPKHDINIFTESIKKNLYDNPSIKVPQMDTQEFGFPDLNNFGYLKNPVADIHLLSFIDDNLTATCNLALNILTNNNMIMILNKLTSATGQSLVMSMYFDLNVGTPAHQDCYYLDTLPPRKLIAAWIALEDIKEKAGRFFVVKETNNLQIKLDNHEIKNSDLYENKIKDYMLNIGNNNIIIPELKKGDVLFWNSGTIHGSTKTLDESFSRKSFTCHFVPNHTDYVQNQYDPTPRAIDGFTYNSVLCRITNTINRDKIRKDLIPRSIKSYDR